MERPALAKMDVSSWWLQAVVLTFLFGFAILGYLAIRIYQDSPPIPGRIVSDSGQTVFTANDIRAGQESFLTYGLMQYRLCLRARRVPRPGFHRRLPASTGARDAARVWGYP